MEIQIKGKLFDEQQIQTRVKELAEAIESDAEGTPIVIVAVLKGSMVFAADLMRYMEGSVQLDTVATSSYGKRRSRVGVCSFGRTWI